MKLATYKVQHQYNLKTFLLMASSLTQFYNADPKVRTFHFIGFVINVDYNNFMLIGNKENTILRTINQSILYTASQFSSICLCTQYHTKKLKNLFKSPKLTTTLQGFVQTHFPPTIEQHPDYNYPRPQVCKVSVLKQRRHLTYKNYYLSKMDYPNL